MLNWIGRQERRAKRYLRVSEPSGVWVDVMLNAMNGSRKRHPSDHQHQQHQEGECRRDVRSLTNVQEEMR